MYENSSPPTVLVAALQADLRHSLAFLLTAEGFAVDSCPTWPPDRSGMTADVVVVDEGSLVKRFVGDARLTALGERVVLLTNKADLARRLPTATVIQKPLLDHALIDAVRCAFVRAETGFEAKDRT